MTSAATDDDDDLPEVQLPAGLLAAAGIKSDEDCDAIERPTLKAQRKPGPLKTATGRKVVR